MTRSDRFDAALHLLSENEKRAVLHAMHTAVCEEDVEDLVLAMERTRRKRASDRATDSRRRVLVGARVPRALAERVKDAARNKDVSVYRFIVDIIKAAVS